MNVNEGSRQMTLVDSAFTGDFDLEIIHFMLSKVKGDEVFRNYGSACKLKVFSFTMYQGEFAI